MSTTRAPRYAVLIDADNVPARVCGPLLEEIQHRVQGVPTNRGVYGDFSLLRNEPWKVAALEHGIEPKMHVSPSRAKNATDIALCIDAMDLFHDRESLIDTFVLVTNDGDFAPLANRLRRSGRTVVAVGTGPALIAASDSHIAVDFSRSPPPHAHTASDVELLVDTVLDLLAERRQSANDGTAGDDGESLAPPGGHAAHWANVSQLAAFVDGRNPEWRRSKVKDFINFRHMLESPPYSEALELSTCFSPATPGAFSAGSDGRLPSAPSALVKVRPDAWRAAKARRALAEQAGKGSGKPKPASKGEVQAKEEETKLEPKAVPKPEPASSSTSWFGWLTGRNSSSQPAVPSSHQAELRGADSPSEHVASPTRAQSTMQEAQRMVELEAASRATAESVGKASTSSTPNAATSPATATSAAPAAARGNETSSRSVNNDTNGVRSVETGGASSTSGSSSASGEQKREATLDDVEFVVGVVTNVVTNGSSSPPGSRIAGSAANSKPPPGERWVHLSVLAWEIDEAAAKAGKGQKWRSSFGRSFSQLLSQEPFAERLEMEAIRVGPSHVDWWVRVDELDHGDLHKEAGRSE